MRALKKLTVLQYDQLDFPEQMLNNFCQEMSEDADMEGFYGIMIYLIKKKSLDSHRRPKKAILSLIGTFIEPIMKKNKFYKFWSVYKLLFEFTIEQMNIDKIQKLQQTIKQLFNFLCRLLTKQPDKKQAIFLQTQMQKYLKLLVQQSEYKKNELNEEAKDITNIIFLNYKVLDFTKLLLMQILQLIDEDNIAHNIQLWITMILNKQKNIFTIEFFEVLCKYLIKSILLNLLTQEHIVKLLLKIYEEIRFIVQKQQISQIKSDIIEYILGKSSLMKDLEFSLTYLYHSQKLSRQQFTKLQNEHNCIKNKVYHILKAKQKNDISNVASLKQLWFYSRQFSTDQYKYVSSRYFTQIQTYSELMDIIKLYEKYSQHNLQNKQQNCIIPDLNSFLKASPLEKIMVIELFSKLANKNAIIHFLGNVSLYELNQLLEMMLITLKIYDNQYFQGLYKILIEIVMLKFKEQQTKYTEKFISQLTKLMDFIKYLQDAADYLVSMCPECLNIYKNYSECNSCSVLCAPLKWTPKSKIQFIKISELYHSKLANIREDLVFVKSSSQRQKILQKILILILDRYCC